MSHALGRYHPGPMQEVAQPRWSPRRTLGAVLVALSVLLWLVLPAVPFLPYSTASKGALAGGFLAGAEVAFWLGLVLLGPELAARVRSAWRSFRPRLAPGERR